MLVYATIDFSKKILEWDGFGFNYVETAQTPDYSKDPQDYGGFSILNENQRREIIDLVFGKDGLKPNTLKMFLDPFHQTGSGSAPFDHKTSTKWMRYFINEGYRLNNEAGRPTDIITTLYGPPAYITKQNILRGRDLNPDQIDNLAGYLVSWVKYLREEEKLTVNYISLHNEGEDYPRWPADGSHGNLGTGHDYNMYWPPEQVAMFMPVLRRALDKADLESVLAAPGETSNWTRFHNWGYADAIVNNPESLKALGLITSHGFSQGGKDGEAWLADHRSAGTDTLRAAKKDLHCWATSMSWGKMNAAFICMIQANIYSAKCNSVIPWAGIQRPPLWVGGDPNPGNAIQINEDKTYEVRKGYYFYKQVSPVGQKGMDVVQASSTNSLTSAMAFGSGKSASPNAFVLANASHEGGRFEIRVKGGGQVFSVYATSDNWNNKALEDCRFVEGKAVIDLPANSTATFVQK
jgi:O-glycosyl hydrolase